MGKQSSGGMKHKTDRKNRGRTSITAEGKGKRGGAVGKPGSTKPNVPEVLRAEVNRAVSAGVKHRGDRRDTSKMYTGNQRHAARGNTPRADVKTRAR
jgi:hypothetical protein